MLVVAALVGGVVLLNAAVSALAQEDTGGIADDELFGAGRDIYGARCAICHGEAGRGTEDGPPLFEAGPATVDFYIRTGRMPLETPREPVVHREQRLSEAEREALIAYVPSFGPPGMRGPEIPELPEPIVADISVGQSQFIARCAACHGATADGIAVGEDDFAPALHEATPLEIAEAVRVGPGVMPVFGEDTMPQNELESVIAWVLELRERESPGGATVGRSGPVSEGFLAWVLGFGLLVVVMYFLGQKTGEESGETDG